MTRTCSLINISLSHSCYFMERVLNFMQIFINLVIQNIKAFYYLISLVLIIYCLVIFTLYTFFQVMFVFYDAFTILINQDYILLCLCIPIRFIYQQSGPLSLINQLCYSYCFLLKIHELNLPINIYYINYHICFSFWIVYSKLWCLHFIHVFQTNFLLD